MDEILRPCALMFLYNLYMLHDDLVFMALTPTGCLVL